MKKYIYTIALLMFAGMIYAQGTIIGKVIDKGDNSALIGASVDIQGSTDGTITDFEGNFSLENVKNGSYNLEIAYIGYATKVIPVEVRNNLINLERIDLESSSVGISEVNVIASIAKDRKTPVAVSTIKGSEIEAKLGNQEYPEILRSTPSIYVTKQGGGFGDSRINVRGFDQRNTAVMINGVPINDMENGWVYWSNWAGLSDVTSSMQDQRGLGASKLAVPSVGGSINIITDAAAFERGGTASISVGNNGYQKVGLTLHTGKSDNGWAFSASGSRTSGSMWAHGTEFEGYSYFASVSKTFNDKHTIQLTGFGAPQWHHQRQYSRFDGVDYNFITELRDEEGWGDEAYKYNPQHGYLQGEEFSWRKNFYHKPIAYMNHYWNINDVLNLKTSAYASIGRGGGTGDLGRINGSFRTSGKFRTLDSGVKFDDIVAWNQGGSVEEFGDDKGVWAGPDGDGTNAGGFAGEYVGTSRDGLIRRASMNEHNWFGVISSLTADFSDNLRFVGGVDARHYKGLHYRRLENLLGQTAYYDSSNRNNPNHYVTTEGRAEGNEIAYWNNGFVSWIGLYGQLEYSLDKLTVFVSASGSQQGFKREDIFNYVPEEQVTPWVRHYGGTVKGGANYNIDENNNVFANVGIFSKQPIFDNVFPNNRNEIDLGVSNQSVFSAEIGYGYRSAPLRANLNAYYTKWDNRQESFSDDYMVDTVVYEDAIFNFSNIAQTHMGIELDVTAPIFEWLEVKGMVSLNSWKYASNFAGTVTSEDGTFTDDATLYAKDHEVPDAAQTTASLGLNLKPTPNLLINLEGYYADRIYSDFGINDRQFLSEGGGEVWRLPSYTLLDGGVSYKFDMKGGNKLTFRVNVNNILDNNYIAEGESSSVTDVKEEIIPGTENASIYNRVYFGFGRTWNVSARFNF